MDHNYNNFAIWMVLEEEQRKKREEEEMTRYSDDDIAGEWEFKIVRSSYGRFQNPEVFVKLLEEESEFGWTLLEKLDDERVRFKRHVRERSRDRLASSGRDPYRSTYGTFTLNRRVLLIVGIIMVVMIFSFLTAYLL